MSDGVSELRVAVARHLERMAAEDAEGKAEQNAARAKLREALHGQLSALHAVLTLMLATAKDGGGASPPASSAQAEMRERFGRSRMRPVRALDIESGVKIDFPSMSAVLNSFQISKSGLQATLSATSADDWRRGPDYLANTPMRHCKGMAFIYTDLLEADDGR